MGLVGGSAIVKRSPAVLLGLAAVLLLLALGAGSARAATCDTSWTGGVDSNWFTAGNWDHGTPDVNKNACINGATVNIDGALAFAQSLALTGARLNIAGGTNGVQAELTLGNGGSLDSSSSIVLTELCSSGCTAAGSSLTVTTGTLANAGTISSDPGTAAGSGRSIFGDATNTGTIQVNAPLTWSGGTVDNTGTISLGAGRVLTFGCCANSATLNNDTNGLITNNGGSGDVAVGAKARYQQGAGTTSPSTVSPAHPAVVMDNRGFLSPAPVLDYTGTGASAIEARGTVSMSGGLAADQSLNINAVSGCPGQTLVTAGSGFTNAGTVMLGGTCDSGLKIGSGGTGTLINQGTLTAASTGTNVSREIQGSLSNSGTLNLRGATAFDGSGASLTQTAGTTLLSGQTLDLSGSAGTFQLQGGALNAPGTTDLNGSLANTGGSVLVGTATAPGHMSVDGDYSQGSGGQLTVIIDGTQIGSGYSQLSVAGTSTLGGKLIITTLSGPVVPHLYTILGGGPVSGKFAQVVGQLVPNATSPTARYNLDYTPKAVALDAEPPTRATTTSLRSSLNPARKGKKVTYAATVSPHPNGGTVRFTSGARTISGCGAVAVNQSTGRATCSVTYHSKGSRKIKATYSGHAGFAGSVSTTLTERVR